MNNRVFSLSGTWKIIRDMENNGLSKGWEKSIPDQELRDIRVPGHMKQTENYGAYAYSKVFPKHHGYVWYYKKFTPEVLPEEGERARIEIDQAGYLVEAYVNGRFLGRHTQHEERFHYDITDCIKEGENLIAIRCFEPAPGGEAIDGIDIYSIPNEERIHPTYTLDSDGGIQGEVRYLIVKEVTPEDVYVRAFPKTGDIDIQITFLNSAKTDKEINLNLFFTEKKTGLSVANVREALTLPVGESVHTFKACIKDYKLWDIDSPSLYLCHTIIDGDMAKTTQFGFKELYVRNGFFFLNGRRIFLKCAHFTTTASAAIGMKSNGFNSVRFLTHVSDPELLDVCDEIGLLVIEAPRSSWGMQDHENTRRMIFDSMDVMIKRDRSRACIGAYYVFNELYGIGTGFREYINPPYYENEVFKAGVDYIKRLREIDQDHIALLNSSRWDGHRMIGSVSNPGSDHWEYEWGAEGDTEYTPYEWSKDYGSAVCDIDGCGDIHPYVTVPVSKKTRDWCRTIGYNTKPLIITETGWGSQSDPVRRVLEYEARGLSKEDIIYKEQVRVKKGLEEFIEENGFSHLFPFPQSFCEETYKLNARQREQIFDLFRSNPMICGYSLTSWGASNEGTLESIRDGVLKPGQSYALQTGWAPLRWALFSDDRTVYADKPFSVEAVLCNEDRLSPGSYKAEARIHSKESGIVWQNAFDAIYPKDGYGNMPPLAATVMKESVTLPAGDYTLNLKLLENECPYGGCLPIKSVKVDVALAKGKKIAVWAIEDKTVSFFKKWGIDVVNIADVSIGDKVLLLVGNFSKDDTDNWNKALNLAENGATVVFVRTEPICGRRIGYDIERNDFLCELAGDNALSRYFRNWLYHFDTIHIDHPVFYNTTPAGIADMETWGDCYPEVVFLRTDKPDTVISAAIGLNCQFENQCAKSQSFCEYNRGTGKIVINGFKLEENIGNHPFADQMLLNIVGYYG